jgi:outer membrane protein assembly factor BamB
MPPQATIHARAAALTRAAVGKARVGRLHLHRPSAATVISLVALWGPPRSQIGGAVVSCWRRIAAVVVSAAALIAAMAGPSMAGTSGAVSLGDQTPPPYAPTGWSTLHAGPANRKYVDTLAAQSYVHRWSVLPGVAMSQAPVIGPQGHVYQTAALGPGHVNLYAFDESGRLLWKAPAWKDNATGVNGCAGFNSPIVDTQGDVYVSDCNKLWAFHRDGTLKWVINLPAAPAGSPFQGPPQDVPVNPFIVAVFTRDGSVLGVTLFGQVVVVSRRDGHLEAPILQLPGSVGPAVPSPPASLFAGGFMDPALVNPLWQTGLAGDVVSANTPAVDESNGLVMVVATAPPPDQTSVSTSGDLYALRFTPGHAGQQGTVAIQFAAPVGAGSGSSPAIAPNDSQTYVTDNNGVLWAVNNTTGKVAWTASTDSVAQSVTVGPDGTVYVAGSADMFAFSQSGTQLWHTTFATTAAALLPPAPQGSVLGGPIGQPSGPMTVTNNTLVEPMDFGYTFQGRGFPPITIMTKLVAISRSTGAVLRVLGPEIDSAYANTVLDPRTGMILATHAPFETASAGLVSTVNPILAPLGLSMQQPVGGLEGLAPAGEPSALTARPAPLRRTPGAPNQP